MSIEMSNNICRLILYCIPAVETLLFHKEMRHVTQNRRDPSDDQMENWLSRLFDIMTFAFVAIAMFELNYIRIYQKLFTQISAVIIFLLIALVIALLTALVRIPEFREKHQKWILPWAGECVKFNFLCWVILAAMTRIIAELYRTPSSVNAFLNTELDPDYTAFLLYSVMCVPFFYTIDIWERRVEGNSKEVEKHKNKDTYTPELWEHMNNLWLLFFSLFIVLDIMLLLSIAPASFSLPLYTFLVTSISLFFICFAFFDQQNQHMEKSLLAYLGKYIPSCRKKLEQYEALLPSGEEVPQESNLYKKNIFLVLLAIELGYLLIMPIRILGLNFDLALCLLIIAASAAFCLFAAQLETQYRKNHREHYKRQNTNSAKDNKEEAAPSSGPQKEKKTARSIEIEEFLVPAAVIVFWMLYRGLFDIILK